MKIALCMVTTLMLTACSVARGQSDPVIEGPEIISETSASDTSWTVIPDESHVQFTATQAGEAFTGHFKRFTTDIDFDLDNIEAASVTTKIDLGSVDAGSSERTDALPGKDWFFVKSFPEAVFTSDDFIQLTETTYEARGTLEIRGVSQHVTLPFTLTIDEGRADMTGALTLNRSDFGVGQGAWESDEWVAFDVNVDVKIAATR